MFIYDLVLIAVELTYKAKLCLSKGRYV